MYPSPTLHVVLFLCSNAKKLHTSTLLLSHSCSIKLAAVCLMKGRTDTAIVPLRDRRRCKFVPANLRGIGPGNGKITKYCTEKVSVKKKLLEICESIHTFNKVSILKRTCLGSQISILEYRSAQHYLEGLNICS